MICIMYCLVELLHAYKIMQLIVRYFDKYARPGNANENAPWKLSPIHVFTLKHRSVIWIVRRYFGVKYTLYNIETISEKMFRSAVL